jgi:hypothetical protein
MAALLASDGSPMMIRLPNGQLVPASGGALVDTAAAPVAAAAMDNSGAMNSSQIHAAGDQAAAQIAAAQALPEVLTAKRGGGAGRQPNVAENRAPAPGLALPQQPAVMTSPEGGGGADLGALAGLMKSLGKNAGSGDSATPAATTPATDTGLLSKFKDFLGIGSKPGGEVPNSGASVIDPNMSSAPGPGPVDSAPLAPLDNSGALASVAAAKPVITNRDGTQRTIDVPTAGALGGAMQPGVPAPAGALAPTNDNQPGFFERNFGGIIDHGDPLTNSPNADTIKARYGDDYKPQDWLDRLKGNGGRMALLTGGLATMANASRPGATPLGAVGEGALAGINTAYGQRAAQKQEDIAALDASSKAKLRDAQGALYDVKGDAALTTAGAASKRADASMAGAKARQTSADASASRAATYAANPFSKGGKTSVFQQKQASWLEAHPDDHEGALAYANGEKQMTPGQTLQSAYGLAGKELAGLIDQPSDPEEWVNNRASEIQQNILAQNKQRAAAPAPSGGAALPASKNPGGALPNGPARGPNRSQLQAQADAAIKRGADPAAVKKRMDSLLAASPGQ